MSLLAYLVPNKEQAMAVVRWLLTGVGAWAIQRGYVDDSQVTMLVGLGVAAVPIVWSMVDKTIAARLKTAAAVPGVTVVVTDAAPAAAKAVAEDPRFQSIVPKE